MTHPETACDALVLFSGGQDSSVCLAWALDRYERVETIGFDYGQRHAVEMQARGVIRRQLAERFPAWRPRLGADHILEIRGFGAIADTAMTAERAFELTDKGLPSTYVPGRNLVFLTYAAALADRRGAKALVGGMCETDFSGYPDCRREALDALEAALNLGMAQAFTVETPLMRLTKGETWGLAQALGGDALVSLILEESHTCYRGERGVRHGWGYGCGDCPACELRAKGWAEWTEAGRPALAP
ncbi:MAG: 7-cyano-7-deazaguanine synthase QueC [Phenylobacterium sp.]